MAAFDPSALADSDLLPLRTFLLDACYRTEALAASLNMGNTREFLSNVARNSLIFSDSLGASPSDILAKLFLLCGPVRVRDFEKLPDPLLGALRGHRFVELHSDGRHVVGKVSITEFEGLYFLADRLFENWSGAFSVTIPDNACMPPHASSFQLMDVMARAPHGSMVLDVGCGSGCLSLPLAESALHVTGIDISARAVGFARANASLNGMRAQFDHADWMTYDAQRRYDHIVFNSPDTAAAFSFINRGLPRLLAEGGHAEVLLVCEVLSGDGDVQGAVRRMTASELPFAVSLVPSAESPFALSRDEVLSGKRPRRTLLVKHPSEWAAYSDSLRRRGVTEVACLVLEITRETSATLVDSRPGGATP